MKRWTYIFATPLWNWLVLDLMIAQKISIVFKKRTLKLVAYRLRYECRKIYVTFTRVLLCLCYTRVGSFEA